MSLEPKDLAERIRNDIHFDEYVPKLGREEDVIVASFKIMGKKPAKDLEHFIERGYDWVLDAESTPGEMEDGDYLVFVEAERDASFPKNFINMMNDLSNLVEDNKKFTMVYFQHGQEQQVNELDIDNLHSIPLTKLSYKQSTKLQGMMESMLNTARVPRRKGDLDRFKLQSRKSR
jgi:hypothetical protein